MDALQAATTDELIAELKVRFPVALVVCGIREEVGNPDEHRWLIEHSGPEADCWWIARKSLQMARQELRRAGGDE